MYFHKTLKRFVKDHSLPIQIVQEPYFSYFVELYDPLHQTKKKLDMLKDAIAKVGSEEKFLELYYQIMDNIIKKVEGTEIYNKYLTANMDRFNVPNKGYPSKDVYNMGNIGKLFMSIDLKKANFQALRYFDPKIVLNAASYEEFIEKFTDLEYMKSSKYLRQVIFGNMNPKRQVKIERYLIELILDWALNTQRIHEENIRSVSNDEIVVEVHSLDDTLALAKEMKVSIKEIFQLDVDIEVYRLSNIGSQKFFIKRFENKPGYKLMCVPLVYYAQVFKTVNNLELNDMDLCFYYENQVCRFLKPLDFSKANENEEE